MLSVSMPGLVCYIYRIIFMFIVLGLPVQNVSSKKFDSICKINGSQKYVGYNNAFQICCNNQLQNRLRDQECCGGREFYYKEKSICCDQKVSDRFVATCSPNSSDCHPHCSPNDVHCSEQMCCGKTIITKSNSLCCSGNRMDLTELQKKDIDFVQCCGKTQLYDVRKEICCQENIFQLKNFEMLQCCGAKSFRPDKNICLVTLDIKGKMTYTIAGSNEAVCGDSVMYNRLEAGCCKNFVFSEPEINPDSQPNPKFSCCDHLLMNPLKEKCCRKHHYAYFDSHTIPNIPELDCCGTGYYNKSSEICNNGTVFKKQFNKLLCGYTYYDPHVEGCCDFVIYQKNKSKCCEGSTRSIARLEDECCNGVGMDKNHICCEGLLAKKRHQDDNECCFSNDFTKAEAYSIEQGERCYQGNVVRGYREGTDPCGAHGYYDPKVEICCNDTVFSASFGCCDGQAYKTKEQMCCFDEIQNLPAALGRCCDIDGKAYLPNDRTNPCMSVCGSKLYDEALEVCCKDVIYREKRDFMCCGGSYINMNKKECCADKHPYKINGHMKCCADRELYNAKTFSCNLQDLVVPKYTNHLCQPKILQSFHRIKHLSCNSTFGVRGTIDKVSLTSRNGSDTDTLNIYFTADRWMFGSSSDKFMSLPLLTFHVEVDKSVSAKCTQHLPANARVMIFFDTKPADISVTIGAFSRVFLFKHTPKREQELYSCKIR